LLALPLPAVVSGRVRGDAGRLPDPARIERAKDLLRSANLTVTEVCFLVGFASLGSFSARALVTLHVWLWYHNPSGIYSGTNPLVTPFNGS
jgi:hypothetical protein